MFILILLLTLVLNSSVNLKCCHDHCDLVELNSFHDCNGRHVYDQVIFYEWAPDQSRYHVRAWIISEEHNPGRQPRKRYSDGLYVVRWTDSGVNRIVTATHYRRSWTQIDPERENKKVLDETLRHQFTKRTIAKVEPIAEEVAQ